MASVFVIQRKNRKRRRIIELYFISIMKLINVLMTASVMDKEFALISNVKIRKIYLFKKEIMFCKNRRLELYFITGLESYNLFNLYFFIQI